MRSKRFNSIAAALVWAALVSCPFAVSAQGPAGGQTPQPQAGTSTSTSTSTSQTSGVASPTATGASPATSTTPIVETADPNYRIGVGDVIDVRVLGEEQMSTVVRVGNSGTIQVPFVKEEIHAQCMTERELSSLIEDRLKKYLRHPEVHASVKEFSGNTIAIIGAVNAPGQFQLRRQVTLFELLVFAGGPASKAGRILNVIHSGVGDPCDPNSATLAAARGPLDMESEAVSLTKLMAGDISQNRLMKPGDIVIVPEADVVFIAGEILKPNAYQLRDGLTLSQLITLAGGPSQFAKTDAIRIVRQEPGKPREEISVKLADVQHNKAPDPQLLANDLVEIPSSTGKRITNGILSTIGATARGLPTRVIP